MTTTAQTSPARETLGFQTEVKQLLQLMIHSLYSNREIFLRELISNASDACDKLRFEALNNAALLENEGEFSIRVSFDKTARTLTVSDNGIGMSRDEAIANLGTIAKSGTREFFSQLSGDQKKDAGLIGQFGVGFYSSFIVADRVTVLTRRAGAAADQGVRWESEGAGEFTIEAIEKPVRGTEITLHLRADQDDLLSGWKLRNIIRKYSDHILQPIVMKKEEWREPKAGEEGDEGGQVVTEEDETVNQASALWAKPKNEISEDPLAWVHARVEGKSEYTQLLYLPARAPFDLYDRNVRHGIKLYVRRVFIMDDAEQLLPTYLRFVRGIVDSADLPLNVSREVLQESKDIEAIRKGCTAKVLGMLVDMAANDKEKYATFWEAFGRVIKEGVGEDFANKEKIAGLLRFASTHNDTTEQTVSLADYIARMKPEQEKIYFVTADTFNAAKNSPHLEVFRKKGIEVLLLSDRVDEWVVSHVTEFDGKPLASVAKGDLDLGKLEDEAEKQAQESAVGEFKSLTDKIATSLAERVKEVRVTYRLTESPACLVSAENDMSGNLARLLKAAGQHAPAAKPTLEINPQHPVVQRLKAEAEREGSMFNDWASVLFDQALLAEGGQLDDPATFVKRMNQLMLEMRAG